MPRIDPLQLLKCLGVLLTPTGGIRSKEEVQRLASLMMKFSKKLVSKCVYILILKNTDIELLGMFMSAGGWTLVLTWLSDGIYGKNWALVIELLELLLMCPVDVERLKSNSIPRLVKGLSKDEGLGRVNYLATKLVDQWLKIVKDETVAPEKEVAQSVVLVKPNEIVVEMPQDEAAPPEPAEEVTVNSKIEAVVPNQLVVMPQQFYKLTVRDGKQIIAKVGNVALSESTEPLGQPLPVGDSTHQPVAAGPTPSTTSASASVSVSASASATTTASASAPAAPAGTPPSVSTATSPSTTATVLPAPGGDKKDKERDRDKEKDRDRDKDKEKRDEDRKTSKDRSKHDKSRHKSSGTSTKSGSSSGGSSSSSSSSITSSKEKSGSSSSSSKSKSKEKERSKDKHRDRDKHRSNGSIKHSSTTTSSSSSSSSSKEKQAEKDKDTLAKIQPKSVDKFGRIPKKSSGAGADASKASDKKASEATPAAPAPEQRTKPSISIEVRKKDGGERPKTVKVFNSKLRSTGLEEAPRPPPPRPPRKRTAMMTVMAVLQSKRQSPVGEPAPLPEKRVKMVEPELEKPGGIKLIAPKPKPQVLQESDMFMDALAASATNKKEPKKRKRRVSKDNSSSSPPASPTNATPAATISPLSSPLSLKSITAPKFYKDTLETDDTKPDEDDKADSDEPAAKVVASESKLEPEPTTNVVKEVNGLKGVLVYHKRRKVKKSVTWRIDSELEEVQYFELDENERVNVTKTFMDMKQMEHVGEREALQLSRKLPNEDLMDERTNWKPLIPIDLPPPLAEPGKKSTEKDIQFAREKVILQALYFNRSMLPDSPGEPDPEHHQITDPIPIPLEDVTGNPDSVNDFQNTPWPEPKGSPLHTPTMPAGPPNMFTNMPPFNPQIGPPGFNAVNAPYNSANFMPPHIMNHGGGTAGGAGAGTGLAGAASGGTGGDWRNMQDPSANMQADVGHPPMNPNMFGNRPDGYGNMMDEGNNTNNEMSTRGGGPGAGGYPPPGFVPGPAPGPMSGPPGHPGPMYPNYSGNNRGGNRGGYRNMGRGGWFRPSGPPPGWHRGGGNSHWGGRGGGVCHQFKMHGFCRQRETCPYMHPQGNQGPY